METNGIREKTNKPEKETSRQHDEVDWFREMFYSSQESGETTTKSSMGGQEESKKFYPPRKILSVRTTKEKRNRDF